MLMVVPGQIIFLLTIYLLNEVKDFKITPTFAAIYLAAAVLQVSSTKGFSCYVLVVLSVQ